MKNKTTHILCETCGVGLVDVIITDKEADVDFALLVHCDYCGSKSSLYEFHGLIQIAGTQHSDLIDYVPDDGDDYFNVYTKQVTGVR